MTGSLCRISDQSALPEDHSKLALSYIQIGTICATIFLMALGVRLLHWQDNRQTFPYAGMAEEYKPHALVLLNGDLKHFLCGYDPPSDANFVKHPPGYPILTAAVFKLFGTSDTALRFVHILLDAVAAVLVFFIAAELFPLVAALIAGLLIALSPQLAYHSIALLPDPLAPLPILFAIYSLIHAIKRPRLITIIMVGTFIGLSCWIRSNAMLLPFFLAALVPFLFERGKRLRYAAALVGATLIVIAPVTIRNYIVFQQFIPLSISAGITLVEGIGAYDEEGRFGLPSNDYQVTKWEARIYNRPDYLGTRFSPDGIKREQGRIARGLAVIHEHPFWFLKVMIHRAVSMLRLARVETVATQPAVTHPLAVTDATPPTLVISPAELNASRLAPSAQTELSSAAEAPALRVVGDNPAALVVTPPRAVQKNTDYLLRLPVKIEQGSLIIDVIDAQRNTLLSSTPVLHPVNWLDLTPERQPAVMVERPFVSSDTNQVCVVLRNGSRKPARVVAAVGQMEMFALGPASHTWTRYPRLVIRSIQRLFLTALMLPLVVTGIVWLMREQCGRALIILLVVPVYYMCTQSALWTEPRYVLAIYYFLFILAAGGLYWAGAKFWRGAPSIAAAIIHRRAR